MLVPYVLRKEEREYPWAAPTLSYKPNGYYFVINKYLNKKVLSNLHFVKCMCLHRKISNVPDHPVPSTMRYIFLNVLDEYGKVDIPYTNIMWMRAVAVLFAYILSLSCLVDYLDNLA